MSTKGKTILVSIMIMAFAISWAFGCTTVIVGKEVSTTGYVIVGHNEDNGGRIRVSHGYVEPQDWEDGTILPSEGNRAPIVQINHTYGYYWSQMKTADGGLSYADSFYNDNGVYLVSNSCANSKVTAKEKDRLTDGGIEYNLRRVIAERATSAIDGVNICIEFIEKYGYVPSGRAYTIADKDEAWVVQVISGRHYIALRCLDDEVVVIPNHYTAHDLDQYDDGSIIYSQDLIEYAKTYGYYEEIDGKFDFAKTFQGSGTYKSKENTYRQKYAMSMIMAKTWEEDYYPFSVVPATKMSPEDVMEILSTHYEGTYDDPNYLRASTLGGNPHDTTLRRICTGTTAESSVCQFYDNPILTTLWTAFGHGCVLPYIPLHPLAGLPVEIDQMEDSSYEMATHLKPDWDIALHENSGWQDFRDFQGLFETVYKDSIYLLETLNSVQMFSMKNSDNDAVEEARYLLLGGNIKEAKELLSSVSQKATTNSLNLLKSFAKSLNDVQLKTYTSLSLWDWDNVFIVTFKMNNGERPIESTIRLGMGTLNTRTEYASPIEGTLEEIRPNEYRIAFNSSDLMNQYIIQGGDYEFFFGGLGDNGKYFGSMALISVVE
ncbi:MAG: C69 family dipeptidase [Sphaerochaetaceae bacterium]|nr:C69 family dipeptidase [Sphaerochaetaceae bacterium]